MTGTTLALALAAGAALTTTALAPAAMRALRRLDVVDVPNHRSSHQQPTLRGGGVAVLAGVLLTAVVATALGADLPWTPLVGAVLLSLLGLADDLRGVGPITRFVAQAFVGAAVGSLLGDHLTALLGAVAVPVLVNAVNFMDGINGITGLTLAAWGAVVVVVAQAPATALLAALALGGALGFLPWNLPRARMFLGDSGSYLFGGLAAMALLTEQSGAGGWWWLLLLAPFVPYLADTGSTLVRRAARGERLTEAHREHLYQRLSRRPAWSHARVAGLWAGAALLSGAVAGALVRQNGMS